MKRTDLFIKGSDIDVFQCGKSGVIAQADALSFAKSLRGGMADVVFVDPPFNLGKRYDVASDIENADGEEYASYMGSLLAELVRTLRPGGAFFLYHVPYWAMRLSVTLLQRLSFRHWIAISMKNGFARGRRLYPAHYALLYFTKGEPRRFIRPRLEPVVCRECGHYVKDYGGYGGIIGSRGVNLSDVWEDLSPVRHKGAKLRRANQLPLTLTHRVMEIAGGRGSLLVDPFVGTGTSLVSAVEFNMRFVANDLSRRSLRISFNRLGQTFASPVASF